MLPVFTAAVKPPPAVISGGQTPCLEVFNRAAPPAKAAHQSNYSVPSKSFPADHALVGMTTARISHSLRLDPSYVTSRDRLHECHPPLHHRRLLASRSYPS